MSNEAMGAIRAAVHQLDWSTAVLAENAGTAEETAANILSGGVPEDEGAYRRSLVALLAGLARAYLFELESDLETAPVADLERELSEIMGDGVPLPDGAPCLGIWSVGELDPSSVARLVADWQGAGVSLPLTRRTNHFIGNRVFPICLSPSPRPQSAIAYCWDHRPHRRPTP